jgi:hypothetical protein
LSCTRVSAARCAMDISVAELGWSATAVDPLLQ